MTEDDLDFYSRENEKVKKGYDISINVKQSANVGFFGVSSGVATHTNRLTLHVGKIGFRWSVLRYMDFSDYVRN